MSPPGSTWNLLPLPRTPNLPPPILYYKFTHGSGSSGLTLQITDLVHLYQTSRSYKQILQQAATSKTSIDPNEEHSQYDILLSKLEDALTGGEGSLLSLRKGKDPGDGGFGMRASIALPPPLRRLDWEFELALLGQDDFTREVFIPLMDEGDRLQSRVTSLKSVIDQKDGVIAKLLDKIESSGVDLGAVFPGVARGKKGISVQHVVRGVPGLARFEEGEWKRGLGTGGGDVEEVRGLVGSYQASKGESGGFKGMGEYSADWTTSLSTKYAEGALQEVKKEAQDQAGKEVETDETASEDDEFERQKTPPKDPQRSVPKPQKPKVRRKSTSSVTSKSSSEEPQPPPPPKQAKSTKKPNKLGALGGKARKPRSPTPEEPQLSPSPAKHITPSKTRSSQQQQITNPATASSESDTDSDLDTRPSQKPTTQPSKPASKLGTIGGKKKAVAPPPRSPTPGAPPPSSATSTPSKSKHKLGNIGGGGHKSQQIPERSSGGKRKGMAVEDESQEGSRRDEGLADKKDKEVEEEEEERHVETEEEKANRKREELKMQLQRGPVVKKKRKF